MLASLPIIDSYDDSEATAEMSVYLNAFVTLNLAVEMVYVIFQRLNAQDVVPDRSAFVLNQIVAVLVSKELITDIMKPQAPYSQEKVKNIIGDIAQSSIMRLDMTSMDKLWDLVTTVFKWQLTLGSNLLKITQRHVSELEDYITNGEILLQLRKIQNIVDNFGTVLTDNELMALRDEILNWLSCSNVKVSLLLKLGLQNTDGTFVTANHGDHVKDVVRNLGQNIYALTQTNNSNNNNNSNRIAEIKRTDDANSNEIDLLVNQLLGEEKFGSGSPERNRLRLNISDHNRNCPKQKSTRPSASFQRFDIEPRDDRLNDLLSDLNINADGIVNDPGNLKDDLLQLIDDNA